MAIANRIAPAVMAESAALNAGQCHPPQWKSKKSTTNPRRIRSCKLPIAPPSISEHANGSAILCALRLMKKIKTAAARAEIRIKPIRPASPDSRRMPKAAPRFCARTIFKKGATAIVPRRSDSLFSAMLFAAKSTAATAIASVSHRKIRRAFFLGDAMESGKFPPVDFAPQSGDAASANFRMRGIFADICNAMPASGAFQIRTFGNGKPRRLFAFRLFQRNI